MTDTHSCGCSEEYGPCDDHSEVMAQREGAAVRTEDELSLTFVSDALALGVTLAPWGRELHAHLSEVMEANRSEKSGTAWLPADALDPLASLVNAVETDLETAGMSVYWDDGYRIVKMKDECPLKD